MIDVLIAAAVARFVLSRLYIALGRDAGPPDGRKRSTAGAQAGAPKPGKSEEPVRRERFRPAFHGPGADGLEAIYEADNAFDPDAFRSGARAAYELLVGAFAGGDLKTLKPLVDDDVYQTWKGAIEEREATGSEAFELLRIRKVEIDGAELDGDTARIMVRFQAELGDGERTMTSNDIWTFKRTVRSSDPNWLLDDVVPAE